jgi:spore germination protein GerM
VKKRPNHSKGILIVAFVVFAVVVGALVLRKYETATRKVEQPPVKAAPAPPQPGAAVVTLFFASADGEGLVREGREVELDEAVEDSVETLVDELISGPVGSHAATALPSNARVLGVRVNGSVAQIDFGSELKEGIPSGSSAETAAVYSVVDTITTNFPQIKAVQFLIEGAPVQELHGHVDLREPVAPDYSLEAPKESSQTDSVDQTGQQGQQGQKDKER